MTPFEVIAADGYRLAAARFEPAGRPRGVVLVAPAMGAAQRYYQPFASWLARQGFTAITFDFRGVGRSAPRTLRGFGATLTDWVALDSAAMVEAAHADAGDLELLWLGHSLGAQILPLVPNASRVARMFMVATGNGYWRLHDPSMKRRAALLWFAVAPAAIAAAGYFPGRTLGMVGDLPAGVMRQWRRWCLHPRYCAGVERADAAFAAFRTPVTALSFTDDEFMSARNTDALYALYGNAPFAAARLAPRDAGVPRIGHFGFFRQEFETPLWRDRLLPALTGA